MTIPRTLIQTWSRKDVLPEHARTTVARTRAACAALDFAWELHDDDDVARLVHDDFPALRERFAGLSLIERIDLWRYLAIYQHGGFYLDLDAEPSDGFAALGALRARPVVQVERDMLWTWTRSFCRLPQFSQFFFGFPARSELLGKVIREVLQRLDTRPYRRLGPFQEVLHTTGPGAFCDALWPSRAELSLFKHQALVRHHCAGSWLGGLDRGPHRLVVRRGRPRYTQLARSQAEP